MVKKLVLIVMISMTLVLSVFLTKPLIVAIISQNVNRTNITTNDNESDANESVANQENQEAKLGSSPLTAPLATPEPEQNPQPMPVEQPSNPNSNSNPIEQPPNPKPTPQPVPVAPQPEVKEATNELEVLRLVNIERQKVGKQPLKYLSALEQGANIRALEIIDLWSHTRPDGTKFVTAFDYIQYAKLGENLASGPRTPSDVVTLWMSSDSHRQNILSENYEHMAISISKNSEGRMYWVQILCQGK